MFGGDKRDRTADLLNAIQALSQLSYTPIFRRVRGVPLSDRCYLIRKAFICQQLFQEFLFLFLSSISPKNPIIEIDIRTPEEILNN